MEFNTSSLFSSSPWTEDDNLWKQSGELNQSFQSLYSSFLAVENETLTDPKIAAKTLFSISNVSNSILCSNQNFFSSFSQITNETSIETRDKAESTRSLKRLRKENSPTIPKKKQRIEDKEAISSQEEVLQWKEERRNVLNFCDTIQEILNNYQENCSLTQNPMITHSEDSQDLSENERIKFYLHLIPQLLEKSLNGQIEQNQKEQALRERIHHLENHLNKIG